MTEIDPVSERIGRLESQIKSAAHERAKSQKEVMEALREMQTAIHAVNTTLTQHILDEDRNGQRLDVLEAKIGAITPEAIAESQEHHKWLGPFIEAQKAKAVFWETMKTKVLSGGLLAVFLVVGAFVFKTSWDALKGG